MSQSSDRSSLNWHGLVLDQLPDFCERSNRFSLMSFIKKAKMAELHLAHKKGNPGDPDRITVAPNVQVTELQPAEGNKDCPGDPLLQDPDKGAALTECVVADSTIQSSPKVKEGYTCDTRAGISRDVFLASMESDHSTVDEPSMEMEVIIPDKGDCEHGHIDSPGYGTVTSQEHSTVQRPQIDTLVGTGKPSKATRRRHASTAERLSKSAFGHRKHSRENAIGAEIVTFANQRPGNLSRVITTRSETQTPSVTQKEDETLAPCVLITDRLDSKTETSGIPDSQGKTHEITETTTNVKTPTPSGENTPKQHAYKTVKKTSPCVTRDIETYMSQIATKEIETQCQLYHDNAAVQTLATPSLSVWNQCKTEILTDKDTQTSSICAILSVNREYQPELVETSVQVSSTPPPNEPEGMWGRDGDADATLDSRADDTGSACSDRIPEEWFIPLTGEEPRSDDAFFVGSSEAHDRNNKANEQSSPTGWWWFIPLDSQSTHTSNTQLCSVPSETARVGSETRISHVSDAQEISHASDAHEICPDIGKSSQNSIISYETTSLMKTSMRVSHMMSSMPHVGTRTQETQCEISQSYVSHQCVLSPCLNSRGTQCQLENSYPDNKASSISSTAPIQTQCRKVESMITPHVSPIASSELVDTQGWENAKMPTESCKSDDNPASATWYISFTSPRWRPRKMDKEQDLKSPSKKWSQSSRSKTSHVFERSQAQTILTTLTDDNSRDPQSVIKTVTDLVKLYVSMSDSSVTTAKDVHGTDVVRDEVVCFLSKMRQEFDRSIDLSGFTAPRDDMSPNARGTPPNSMVCGIQPRHLGNGSDFTILLEDTGASEQILKQNSEFETEQSIHSNSNDNLTDAKFDVLDPESQRRISDPEIVDLRCARSEKCVRLDKDLDRSIFPDPGDSGANEQILQQISEFHVEKNSHSISIANLTDATFDIDPECQRRVSDPDIMDVRCSRSEPLVRLDMSAFPVPEDARDYEQMSEFEVLQNSHSSSNGNLTEATFDIDPECQCGLNDPNLVNVRSSISDPFLRVSSATDICTPLTKRRRSLSDCINHTCDTCQSMIIRQLSRLMGPLKSDIDVSSAPVICARGASATWSAPMVPKESWPQIDIKREASVPCYEDENGWTIPDVSVPVIDKECITWNIARNRSIPIVIGKGTFGDVKLAAYTNPEGWCSDVAIKVFNGTSDILDIVREAKFLQYLQNTDVFPEFYGCLNMGSEEEPKLCLVQELFGDGKTLHHLIDKENRNPYLKGKGWMSICIQLAKGLRKIHAKNIIFNDLKENNILVNAASVIGRPVIKFIDVGISTFTHGVVLDDPAEQLEEMKYLAPEVRGRAESTALSDIYSLGKIYERMAAIAGIPGLHWVAMACCKPEPKRRMSLDRVTRYLVSIARCRKLFGVPKSLVGRCSN